MPRLTRHYFFIEDEITGNKKYLHFKNQYLQLVFSVGMINLFFSKSSVLCETHWFVDFLCQNMV